MALNNQARTPTKFFGLAPKGASAAIAMWKVGASVVTLLAALFYGIGRFLADGFYAHLNTTASAAGVNTISIIEPAAVLGAFLALFATVVLMLLDILQRGFDWIQDNAGMIVALMAAGAVTAGAIWGIITYFREVKGAALAVGVFIIAPIVASSLRIVIRVSTRAKVRGKAVIEAAADAGSRVGAEAGAVPGPEAGEPNSISNLWPRITLVGVTAVVVIGLCIGAHYVGVHEANQVKKGLAVDISEAGLDISSIGAIPVRLQPIDSSHAIESISAYHCLLEIGSGASDLIFYDANKQETFSVPTSEVVVVSLDASKQCVGSATTTRQDP